jgi:peptidoglycan/LPS O-acetylase OafA/YrhL
VSEEVPSTVRALGHVPELDGIRGIAILLVVAHHTHAVLAPSAGWLPNGGFLGVDVFFVLSGFLITSLLLGEHAANGRLRLWRFYGRRALRLLPALFTLLGAYLVYAYITDYPAGPVRSGVLSIAFYYSNWRTAYTLKGAPGLGGLWSLAVEEQFYLVWPFVVLALLWIRRRVIIGATIAAAIMAVLVHRAQLYEVHSWLVPYIRTDTRADGLLVGALCAVLWSARKVPRRGVATAATLGASLVGICVFRLNFTDSILYRGGFTLVAVAVGAVILAAIESPWFARPALRWPVLRVAGRVSYGLYLWHIAIFFAVARYGTTWGPWLRVLVAYPLVAIAVALSWRCVERPSLAMKDRRAAQARRSALQRGRST